MNENETTKITDVQVLQPSAIEQVEKASIDIQIATAHKYPRSLEQFKKRGMAMVSLDEETAQSCIYRRPVGKDREGKPIFAEGKSVRMAEIVGACYGNIRVGAMLIEDTERYVKARGFAHDLESNFMSACEVVESTVDKNGKPYSERMRIVVAKACLAKARRDATFQVIPGALCKSLEDTARKTAIGTEATLSKRRSLVLDWIGKMDIDAQRVWNALKVKGVDDVGLNELELLTGIRTAMKDGDTSIDEAFPADAGIVMPKAKAGGKKKENVKDEVKKDKPPSRNEDKESALVEEIKMLIPEINDDQLNKFCNAIGVDSQGGEAWELANLQQLTTLRSLITAQIGSRK